MRLQRLGPFALITLVLALTVGLAVPASSHTNGRALLSCGVERWPVKTLTDRDARFVRLRARATTIAALRMLAPHPRATQRLRAERQAYRVEAILISFKLEDDEDIHLVVADPGERHATLIVEFPHRDCTIGAKRSHRYLMQRARAALVKACGEPPRRYRALDGRARISGVLFFDRIHGQRGVAPNGVELHPVTGFRGSCA